MSMAGFEGLERLAVVARHDDRDLVADAFVEESEQALGGRARRDDDLVAGEVGEVADAGIALGHQSRADDEDRDRKADLALTFGVVAGGAALEIDRAVLDQRDPVLRRHRHQPDRQRRQLELGLDRVEYLEHQVVRIADHLLLVVVVGERDRRLAVAETDRAGLGDPLERVRDLGADRRADSDEHRREQERRQRDEGVVAVHGAS